MNFFFSNQRNVGATTFICASILLLRVLYDAMVFATIDSTGASTSLIAVPLLATSALLVASIAFLIFETEWLWRTSSCLAVAITFTLLIFANSLFPVT
jgi:hypothetical protein